MCVNKNVVKTISHNEYKDVLLNNKWLRHLMNRTQSEINKIYLSCLIDKIHNRNSGYDGLVLGYQGYLNFILIPVI